MAKMRMLEAIRAAIREEMLRDERVFCIGEDIGIPRGFGGAFQVTLGLSDEFGHERILDTPISEAGLTGVAIGAAVMGLRPIADLQYCDFIFCAMDQLVNQLAKLHYMSGGSVKVPMVMRAPVGATSRGAQHGQSVESYFMHVPGLKIACPGTPYDAKGLLKTAVRDDDPVLFFEHKKLYGSGGARKVEGAIDASADVPDDEYLIPFGEAAVRRPGKDVTIVADLLMVYEALAAAEKLAKEGVECEVIDPRTLVPFDYQTLYGSVRKTGRLVIVHEDTFSLGWGAEIAARVSRDCFDYLDAPVERVTAPDTPVPFSPPMERFYVPDAARIIGAVRRLL
jgi:pyruvate dehydrogenase E1 component beta subunit